MVRQLGQRLDADVSHTAKAVKVFWQLYGADEFYASLFDSGLRRAAIVTRLTSSGLLDVGVRVDELVDARGHGLGHAVEEAQSFVL